MQALSTKKCLICNKGRKNDTLYWHCDPDDNSLWCWCNKCARGYSIYQYCYLAGISLKEFLELDFDFVETKNNELQKMAWPHSFVPLYDQRAAEGVEYIKTRGIVPDDGIYYDTYRKGIVFPYYYGDTFVGAQVRLLNPWVDDEGDTHKIDTIPGTRLGLLFYGWNQTLFRTNIQGVIVTEGAFNAICIQQALNEIYGGAVKNPFKCVACSGSGVSTHHMEALKELKDNGVKIIAAPDSDEAGLKMLEKMQNAGIITHVALTEDDELDWNDVMKTMDKRDFATWFLKRVKSV